MLQVRLDPVSPGHDPQAGSHVVTMVGQVFREWVGPNLGQSGCRLRQLARRGLVQGIEESEDGRGGCGDGLDEVGLGGDRGMPRAGTGGS